MATKKQAQAKPEPTERTWDVIVAEARDAVLGMADYQWRIGDLVLEAVPMRPFRSHGNGEDSAALQRFADEIGVARKTIDNYRWAASRWPADKRDARRAHHDYVVLGSHPDRFELIRRAAEEGWTWRQVEEVARRKLSAVPTAPEAGTDTTATSGEDGAAKPTADSKRAIRLIRAVESYTASAIVAWDDLIEDLTDEEIAVGLGVVERVKNGLGWFEFLLRTRVPLDAGIRSTLSAEGPSPAS